MTPSSHVLLRLECLESREVPASVFHYTDVDGDKVTVTASTGTLMAGLFTMVASGLGEQLQKIDLSGGGFDGANLTFSVATVPGGDGLANVGYIDSTGHDLGAVIVKGDLGQVDAGTNSATVPAIKSLTVNSLGRLGLDTQPAGGDLASDIIGAFGTLTVKQDVAGAFVSVTGANGKIGATTIGGSLIGGSSTFSGEIFSSGDMGAVKIGQDVLGNSGSASGIINSQGKLAGVSIGGSLIGGSNAESGEIFSNGNMGAVKIGHDVQGGSGFHSGFIDSNGKLAGVTIGGALIGGSDTFSGAFFSNLDMGTVKIGHDVQGGSGPGSGLIDSGGKLAGVTIGGSLSGGSNGDSGAIISQGDMSTMKIGHDFTGGSIAGSASLDSSGLIECVGGRIDSVTIGGSIISGMDNSSGTLTMNATIRSGNDIGSLTVQGSLIGHGDAGSGASPVVISARGQAVQGSTTDLAIGKIRIGGRVEFANILAGYDLNLTPVNGDAQIGAVKVGGDWAASNLVAGAKNTGAPANTNFGDGNDASIGAGSASILATIASITIGGQVIGTPASVSAADHFGFVAQQIGAVKIGGNVIGLVAGPHNDNHIVGETSDMTVHEV